MGQIFQTWTNDITILVKHCDFTLSYFNVTFTLWTINFWEGLSQELKEISISFCYGIIKCITFITINKEF